MDRSSAQRELGEALARLETELLTPVVSGELAPWHKDVEQAAAELATRLRPYLTSVLPQEYRQIATTDQELLGRVQQLTEEDRALLEALDHFLGSLENFAPLVQAALHHESKAEEQRVAVEQEGLNLVLRVRRQMVSVDTWLAEAVYRDRGTKD